MRWFWALLAGTWSRADGYILLLAEDWSQPTDLSPKSSANMLRLIGDQLLDTGHDIVKESFAFEQRTEALNTLSVSPHAFAPL